MNIALEQTKEIVDGKMRRNYGDAFVRGNNGMLDLEHGTVNDANDLSQSCTSQPTHETEVHSEQLQRHCFAAYKPAVADLPQRGNA